jgi:hypothetical protein
VITLGDRNTLAHSFDGGETFQHLVNVDPNSNGQARRVIVHPDGPTYQFAWLIGTTRGKVLLYGGRDPVPVFSHDEKGSVRSLAVSGADPDWLYVTLDTGKPDKDKRIYLVELEPGRLSASRATNITYDFPDVLNPRVICGDPHRRHVVYVGTEKGVYRLNLLEEGLRKWHAYVDGFPLTTVVDLEVAPDKTLFSATKGRGAWRVITDPGEGP